MGTLGPTLSLLSVVVSIAGTVGLALGVLFSARCRGVIDLLRTETDALKGKIARLESERNALDDRVKTLEADKRALAEVATGATAVAQLSEIHRVAHAETLAAIEAVRLLIQPNRSVPARRRTS